MNRHASSELLQNLRVYQSYYQHPSPFCPVGKLYRVHEIHEVMWCATVIMGGVRHQNNHNNIMRHYASLCVIMRYYGYFESLCVIMRAYFEGVRQMSFIMSRIITVFIFQKI